MFSSMLPYGLLAGFLALLGVFVGAYEKGRHDALVGREVIELKQQKAALDAALVEANANIKKQNEIIKAEQDVAEAAARRAEDSDQFAANLREQVYHYGAKLSASGRCPLSDVDVRGLRGIGKSSGPARRGGAAKAAPTSAP